MSLPVRAEGGGVGFESVWAADHIVLPTQPTSQYPYTADGAFGGRITRRFWRR